MRRRLRVLLCAAVLAGCATPQFYEMAGLEMVRARRTEPLGIHRGAWEDMKDCLGSSAVNGDLTPDDVLWVRADSIVDTRRNVYVYGATVKLSGEYRWMIAVENAQWRYVHTVSHEELHVLANADNSHPPDVFRCEYPSQVGLPFRTRGGP